MMRAFRPYLNAALIGFIVTLVVYLYVQLDRSEITKGLGVSAIGALVVLVVYIILDKKFGGNEPELFDKDGNLIDRNGKILKAKSQL